MRNVSENIVAKIKHILGSKTFLPKIVPFMRQCGEVLRSRTGHRWRMRIARWIPKAIETHSEYEIFIDFPLQQWLDERTSVYLTRTLPVLLFRPTSRSQCGLLL
jgi:hypothetical protein